MPTRVFPRQGVPVNFADCVVATDATLHLKANMKLLEFQPENKLEFSIFDAKQGIRSIDELMNMAGEWDLYVQVKMR